MFSNNKRKLEDSEGHVGIKKEKLSSEDTFPAPPQIKLALSVLRWAGKPTPHCVDEGPKYFGAYVSAGRTLLKESGWSSEHKAHIYKPMAYPHYYDFKYKRERFVGTLNSEFTYWGGVWGDPDPDPILHIHRLDNKTPFVARLGSPTSNDEKLYTKPPFHFMTEGDESFISETLDTWENPPYAEISLPDLQIHDEAKDPDADSIYSEEDSDREEDSGRYTGFEGSWPRAFIALVKGKRPLGMLKKTIWTYDKINEERHGYWEEREKVTNREGRDPVLSVWKERQEERGALAKRPMWAAKVKLEPIVGSVKHLEKAKIGAKVGKDRLISYQIRARLLEVYIKPEFLSKWIEKVSSSDSLTASTKVTDDVAAGRTGNCTVKAEEACPSNQPNTANQQNSSIDDELRGIDFSQWSDDSDLERRL